MTKGFKGYIYKHTSPSGKVYIGQTANDLEKRFGNGNNYNPNTIFGKAIKKYGWENFTHEILHTATAPTKQELLSILNALEEKTISKYQATNRRYGYNMKNGGSNFELNKEIRHKISQAHRGKPPWNKGKTGFKMSQATKQKIAIANKGKSKPPFTTEHRKKIGLAGKGKPPWNKGKTMPPPANKGFRKYPEQSIIADIKNGLSYSQIQKKYDIKSSATITYYKNNYRREKYE